MPPLAMTAADLEALAGITHQAIERATARL
jgi:hypothetical protein